MFRSGNPHIRKSSKSLFTDFIKASMVFTGLELIKSFLKICDGIHYILLSCTSGHFYRVFIFYKIISSFFQFQGKFLWSGFDNSAIIQYMYKIGHDIIQQTLVMCYDQNSIVFSAQFVYAV